MQAQPKWFFVFRSKKNRNYVININTNEGYTGITYKDLSFNSLVGWLGHEMAHIADYNKKYYLSPEEIVADMNLRCSEK